MTETEIISKKLDNKAKGKDEGVVLEKSEEQIKKEKEEKERLIYGRYWIWEGYFSDKTQEKWLNTAEALKHIND
jgi:hypothetical protein|tara:strand:+ start:464 stop:685 length:222 start_codon:yes stop_codon:yes gene_type:complete